MNECITTHRLDFESKPWNFHPSIQCFKIGTCHGQWYVSGRIYTILTIINECPGNGHLDDVFQWFENSAKRDKYGLAVNEIMNERFYQHLVKKRGFRPLNDQCVIKYI